MATKNILIKGSFDVSQILASFKQIRNEAEKSNISEKILGGYDKELEKVEKLTTQILAAQGRGLTDNLSIKEFARLVSQLEKQYGILNVKAQAFTDAANYKTETAEIKQYSTQLKTLIDRLKSLEKSARDYIDANSDSLKLSKEESKALKLSISDAQAYKDVLDEIVKKRIEAAKAKVADRSLSTTGGALKYAEITGLSANFTLSAADKKGRDSSRKSLVNKNGNYDEAKALAVANEEYNRILEESIAENKTAEEALEDMIKTMRAYKLELGDTDEVLQKFTLDMASIKEAAWENHGNLTDNDKGAYTRAGNNVAKILNDALGLYNNADAGKAQLVAKEAEETSNRLMAALNQLELAIDNTIEKEKELAATAGKTAQELVDGCKNVLKEALKYVSILDSILEGFDRIGQGAKQILSVTTSWSALRNVVKSTFNDIKDLDKAFGSIAMVTSYSVKDMWALYDLYAAMANKLGLSTKSVVEASALYYQQGLKTNLVMLLTEETMKLATLAGLDFKDATSQMTAALRAFHMDMSEGAHVTDVYAEVAAHAAVDVLGLSEAMSACASIANSSGMSFEKTTAMLATMTEATQEAPKNLGTALKTVLARFTELKTNVAGTAESEFDDLDYNKVDKALKSVGVLLKDTNGLFRNMDDVLLELSSKWSSLDRNSLRYIATIAAGSRQQSRFIALMENYERTMQLVNVALNSAGRSSLQFAKYLDTVEYRLNKISNTWELFKTGLLSSDFYKDVLDNFNSFLNKLNDTSAAGLATLAGTWLTFGRKAISGTLTMGSNFASNFFTGERAKSKFKESVSGKDGYTMTSSITHETIDNEEAINKAWEEQKVKNALKGLALGTAISASITAGITSGLASDTTGNAVVTSIGSSLIPNIMAGILMGGPHGAILAVGATIATGLIAGIINHLKNKAAKELNKTIEQQVKNTQKALDNSTSRLELKLSEARDTLSTIDDLKDIEKLYNELKNKVVLTEEELEKYNKLVDNLKENYPSLIAYYDEETKKIRLNNEELKKRKDTLTELEKLQNADALLEQFYNTSLAQEKSELDVKNKYYSEIKSTLGLSSSDAEELSKKIASINSSGIEDFKSSIIDLAKKNEASKEVLDLINTTLEDFEASYNSVQDKDDENYNLILSLLRSENEKKEKPLTDTEMRIRAEKILKEGANVDDEVSKRVSSLTGNISQNNVSERAWLTGDDDKSSGKNMLVLAGRIVAHANPFTLIPALITDAQNATVEIQEADKLKDWENLDTNVRDFLKNELKYTEDSYKQLLKDSGNDIELVKKTLTQKTEAYYKTLKYKEDAKKELTPEEQEKRDKISKLEKNYQKYSVNELQAIYDKYAEEEGGGENGKKKAKELLAGLPLDELESYQTLLEEFGLKSDKTFLGLSAGVMEYSSQILQSLKDTFGADSNVGEIYKEFVESIQKFNLPKDLTNKLLSFNPKDLEGQTKEDAKESLMTLFNDAINSGQITKEAAEKTAEQYLDNLEKSGIGNFSIKNASAIDAFIEKAKKKYQDTVTNYKSAIDTINSNISNGFINYLDKDKIELAIKSLDLDPSKYLFTDKQGNYQIDVDKLNKDVENLLLDENKITEELQGLVKEGINLLTQKKSIIRSIISLYNAEALITKELALQREILSAPLDSNFTDIAKNFAKSWDGVTATFTLKSIEDMEAEIKAIDTLIEELRKKANDPKAIEALKKERLAAANAIKGINKTNTKTEEDFKKAEQDAAKDLIEKNRAEIEAKKALAKAIENVTEKQKELKAVIEGTNWKSSVDGMYNYNTALDFLTKQTERAKKNFDKVSSISEAKNNFQVYGQGLLNLKAQLTAQNQTYRTAYKNIGKVYNNDVAKLISGFEDKNKMKFNLADYLVFDEKTGTKINMNALQKAKMPEALKKWIETQGQKANEYLGKILDNEDKIDLINEEFLEQLRKARDEYINLQDLMIDVLREKYLKEIDDLLNKYDAMNEADNKYLESLQKNLDRQRKLRDLEKNWNDLTDKERKLSLMLRDTSGGNLTDVKNLLNEIEDLRTLLLDDAVDLIIEKLTEFYELLKEARDAEIQYKLTLIDDVNLLKEATEALEKILTSDDLVNWWKKNVTNIKVFSEEKLTKLTEDWDKLFNAKSNYVASIDDKMKKSIEDANGHLKEVGDLAEKIVKTTSEGITNLAEQSLQEAGEEYKKAVKAAKDALLDAVDAVEKLKLALLSAIEAAEASKKAFDDIHKAYMEYLVGKEKPEGKPELILVIYVNGEAYTNQTAANRASVSAALSGHSGTLTKGTVDKGSQEHKDAINRSKTDNSTSVFKDTERYIGKNSSGEIVVYGNKKSFDDHNPYKDTKETIKIREDILHGVIWYDKKKGEWTLISGFSEKATKIDAEDWIKRHPGYYYDDRGIKIKKDYRAFAEGGLVNYTGPAWVDGSRSKPEAFLSSEDTRRIGEAARILADLPILSQPVKEQVPTTTIGDTTIQIDVHVDSIANDYDLDEAMNKVEQRIVNAAKYAGSNVILKKH